LFPYVRAYVTTYTALNGIPPYVLPLIDFESAPVNLGAPPRPQPMPQQGKKSGIDGVKIIPPDSI
ncbi:MAG: protein-export chaperone SecB, partial [Clostridia bacterium]|nr:protein-export chaperone SecB [Clostridia bacterium]